MSPAATAPAIGYGVVVTWAGHDVGFITNVNLSGIRADTKESSNNDSADAHKEYVAGFVDGGELSIEARWIPGDTTGQKYFLTDLHARTLRQVIVTYPDAISKWTFNAIPTGWDQPTPYDDMQNVTMTMKITGKPAFTNS